MRTLIIAAPWITATAAAFYAISQWDRLPARMAVHFSSIMGSTPNGWQAKSTAIPTELLLMFGALTVFTVMLSRPGKIRIREGALSDPVEDRRRAVRVLLAAHIFVGVLLPLSVVLIVNRNL